jgi:hypothetical protein
MRAFGILCLIGVIAAGASACGGKKDEAKQAEQAAQQAAQSAGTSAQEMAKGLEQFGNAMQQMQKGPNGENVEVVDFKALQSVLPTFDGWEREEPKGESMTAPFKFSQAETAYTKDDARIELKVVDTAMARMMTLPYQMFLATGYSKQSSTGYEKATKIAGQPGWEKWDSESKRAEVGLVVNQRFLVTVEGSNTDTKTVQALIGKIDMGKLAGLK